MLSVSRQQSRPGLHSKPSVYLFITFVLPSLLFIFRRFGHLLEVLRAPLASRCKRMGELVGFNFAAWLEVADRWVACDALCCSVLRRADLLCHCHSDMRGRALMGLHGTWNLALQSLPQPPSALFAASQPPPALPALNLQA
jgi:hypothetical protein